MLMLILMPMLTISYTIDRTNKRSHVNIYS